MTLRNRIASQLGAIEAAVALEADRTIEAPAERRFYRQLAGDRRTRKRASRRTARPAVDLSCGHEDIRDMTDNFFLGAGELSNLVRLIAGVN